MVLLANLIDGVLYLFIIVLLVRIAFSWLSPYSRNSLYRIAYQVTEPVLAPVRRVLPPVSGFDLSPLVVTLVIYFVLGLVANLVNS